MPRSECDGVVKVRGTSSMSFWGLRPVWAVPPKSPDWRVERPRAVPQEAGLRLDGNFLRTPCVASRRQSCRPPPLSDGPSVVSFARSLPLGCGELRAVAVLSLCEAEAPREGVPQGAYFDRALGASA